MKNKDFLSTTFGLILLSASMLAQASLSPNAGLGGVYVPSEFRPEGGVPIKYSDYSGDLAPTATIDVSHSYSQPNATAAVSMSASVGPGYLHALTTASASGNVRASAYSSSSFFDEITFSSAAHNGEMGFFTAEVIMDYDIQHTLQSGNAQAPTNFGSGSQFNLQVTTGIYQDNLSQIYADQWYSTKDESLFSMIDDYSYGWASGIVPEAKVLTVYGWFYFGSEMPLQFYLALQAHANAYGDGVADTSTMFSAYWGGIKTVGLWNGPLISDYTVSSISGADYQSNYAPVPEPQVSVMLAVGLLYIYIFHRKSWKGRNKYSS